jgi:hypothetical protein
MFNDEIIRDDDIVISKPYLISDHTAHEPDLCLDDHDTIWVTWSERRRSGDLIRIRCIDKNGMGDILDCSTRQGVEFQPAVISLEGEEKLVTWVAYRAGKWCLVVRELHHDRLGDEEVLYSNQEGIFHPRLQKDPNGEAWLVFEAAHGGKLHLMVNHTQNGQWGAFTSLSTQDAACCRPSLSPGPGDGIWAAYDCYGDGHYQVFVQRLDQPAAPIRITDNGYQNLPVSIAADREKNLWIAWSSNQNTAYRDRWWLTKWVYLRRFDGKQFSDPVCETPAKDIYNQDSFQGWEFPEVTVDAGGRIWVFGQASHTLYAQYYAGDTWSPRYTIAPPHWGSWKPRVRLAGTETLVIASMGLGGAQIQQVQIQPAKIVPVVVEPREPLPVLINDKQDRQHPAITTSSGETLQLFFGDLHGHSIYGDGTGDVDEYYHRYRDAYGYDFACLTEHDYLDHIELSLSELKMVWNQADRMTIPGKFVAFCGYEWTAPAIAEHSSPGQSVGEGHKHIIYPENNGPLISYGDPSANTGAKLLARFEGVEALIIPHHTSWSGIDWDAHDENLVRLVEVCSTHGRFEYPGNQPIGYRRDHVHLGKFVLDALDRGYKLGFVGGSDSHGLRWHGAELADRDSHMQPGMLVGWKEDAYRTGMTVILAHELTRHSLYQALYERRCYATSGVPIELDFRINGELMGSEITTDTVPKVEAKIKGTAPIRSVDLIRSGYGHAGLQSREGAGLTEISFSFEDKIIIPGEEHYYYLRVSQEDGNMAWSSPIWLRYEG